MPTTTDDHFNPCACARGNDYDWNGVHVMGHKTSLKGNETLCCTLESVLGMRLCAGLECVLSSGVGCGYY